MAKKAPKNVVIAKHENHFIYQKKSWAPLQKAALVLTNQSRLNMYGT